VPPPTPKSALKKPAAEPDRGQRDDRADRPAHARILVRWICWPRSARRPKRRLSCSTSTGTLAPIAPLPELARVPAETRAELARLAGSYLLVACISGRSGQGRGRTRRRRRIRYVGNHGTRARRRGRGALPRGSQRSRDSVELPVEDKGLSLSYHYRSVQDQEEARAELEERRGESQCRGARRRGGAQGARDQAPGRGRQGNRRAGAPQIGSVRRASTRAMTRPISTPSRGSPELASSTPCASRWSPTRARWSSSPLPTSSFRAGRACDAPATL
jgi:hypothetical protein